MSWIQMSFIYNYTAEYIEFVYDYVYENYFDVYYFEWVLWLVYPLILTFILPAIILLFVYASALFLHLYRWRHHLKDAYSRDFWDGARHTLAAFWDAQGKIWHGYDIVGLEKIPDSGPALLVYYHGAIPVDLYYILAKCFLHKNRTMRAVGDRFLFKIPGLKVLLEVMFVMPGTVKEGVKLMRQGHLFSISPGGVREAYFSDEYYELMWNKRCGFAKIALEAEVPIIPIFTRNCREAFRSLSLGKSLFRKVYEKTRLPIVPIYGGFPVKLRTYVGDPIPHDPSLTPEQLATKVEDAIKDMIHQHQQIPGNIMRALKERFTLPAVSNHQAQR